MKPADFLQMRKRVDELLDTGDVWAVIRLYEAVLVEIPATVQDQDQKEMRLTALRAICEHLIQVQAYRRGIELSQQYYEEAKEVGHRIMAQLFLGEHHLSIGHYQQAQEAYMISLSIAQETGDELGRAKALAALGLVSYAYGQYETAINQYQRAINVFLSLGDWYSVAIHYNRLGVAYQHLGEFDKAIEEYQRYYQLLQRVDGSNASRLMIALNNLAESYTSLFDYEKAQSYLEQALRLQYKNHDQSILGDICRNYGWVLCQIDRVEEGLEYLHRAYELSRQLQKQSLHLQALYSLAWGELVAGDDEMGLAYALRLHQLAEANQLQGDLAKAHHVLGLYEQSQGRVSKARQHWLKGVTIAKETKQKMLLWQLHQLLGDVAPSTAVRRVHRHMAAELVQKIADLIQDFTLKESFLAAPSVKGVLQMVCIAL